MCRHFSHFSSVAIVWHFNETKKNVGSVMIEQKTTRKWKNFHIFSFKQRKAKKNDSYDSYITKISKNCFRYLVSATYIVQATFCLLLNVVSPLSQTLSLYVCGSHICVLISKLTKFKMSTATGAIWILVETLHELKRNKNKEKTKLGDNVNSQV